MAERTIDPENLALNEDWFGNNAAFTCPVSAKVFLVSAMMHKKGRACPQCSQSTGFVVGGRQLGGSAKITWEASATASTTLELAENRPLSE